jgi:K+-transporting ATPase KdpF subunit
VAFDYLVGLVASLVMLGYLLLAMLKPEKF